MTVKPLRTWLLPLTALAQTYVGTVFVSLLRQPVPSWDSRDAVLSALAGLAGLGVLALAVRNCFRLWGAQRGETSWALIAAAVTATILSVLWATAPMTVGIWACSSLIPGTFATYLIVVMLRQVARRPRVTTRIAS